eukprot:s569_g20.t1
MTFCRAFATLAPLLAFRGASLKSSQKGSSRCPCIEEHSEFAKAKLAFKGLHHDQFGIGCKTHKIDEGFAVQLYQSGAAAQLNCGPSPESPWCNTKWCYVNRENCHLNWEWGVLGQPYSYATCGNLRQGSDKYFQKSMAAFLQGDSLRVFHPENSLERGYLGNTECHDHDPNYPQNRKCRGRIAEFWATALDELNRSQVQVDHTVIRGGENGIDPYFIDFDIKNAFEEYKERFPKQWAGRPSNNFDLCAFATGMGYVDLCTGAFSLTDRRQAMTFVIELYTSPVFMVSKSKCDFLGSDDWGSERFWAWWFMVFSPKAWLFFAGVVFFFIVAMKGLDHCFDKESGPAGAASSAEPGGDSDGGSSTDSGRGPSAAKPQTSAMDKPRKCVWCLTHRLADALFGVFEAFVFKSKTSHRRLSKKPGRSRPSHMLRLGLGFFILLSTTLYGSNITSKLILAKEVKGEIPSLQAARDIANNPFIQKPITLCTNSALKEALESDENDDFLLGLDTWEEVLTGLTSGTCNAALLAQEAWDTFRNRAELCGFYKEPTPEFYLPQGAVVSKRAYRTLETFRFAPAEPAVYKSIVPADSCHGASAEELCDNKGGLPWYTFFSLFLVAATCGLCSLLGIVHKEMGGEDSEIEEEKIEIEEENKRLRERITEVFQQREKPASSSASSTRESSSWAPSQLVNAHVLSLNAQSSLYQFQA